jgi:hypothetical protein
MHDSPPAVLVDILKRLPCRGDTYGAEAWLDDPNHYPEYARVFRHVGTELVGMESLLEIGTLYGYSLVAALFACPDLERIHFVDDESGHPGSNAMAAENVRFACGELGRSPVEVTFSRPGQPLPGGPWPVAHLDGDHAKAAVARDLEVAERAGATVIVGHDWFSWPGVQAAVGEFVAARPALALEVDVWPVTYGAFLLDLRPKAKPAGE